MFPIAQIGIRIQLSTLDLFANVTIFLRQALRLKSERFKTMVVFVGETLVAVGTRINQILFRQSLKPHRLGTSYPVCGFFMMCDLL